MNTFFRNSAIFFKRYFVIVLACVLAGNFIAWMNGEKSEHFYQYVIKARSRVDYYDLVKSHFEKISQAISDSASESSPLKAAPIESYRNEDFYYIELKLRFKDTASASPVIDQVIALIKSDSELKKRYFDRLENMSLLIEEAQHIIHELEKKLDTAKHDPSIIRMQLFQSKVGVMNLTRDRDNFGQNVSIYFPTSKEFTAIKTGNTAKTYLTATILFFIIGLFIAVVVDRFRN